MDRKRFSAWWAFANTVIFLLWIHFAVRDAKPIVAALTETSGQVTLAVSLLLTGWAIYYAVIAGLSQRKAGRLLFHLEIKWKRFFILAGLFLAATSLGSIFLTQITNDPISMITGIVRIAGGLFAGMVGLVDTGITEKGLMTPFALVPWSDVESFARVDDRHIVFRARARLAGFHYTMSPTFTFDPAQRRQLDTFLSQMIRPRP
ncbi:MAG: hypothetical protein M0Z41_05375 [Peptococcaceae bacterium]|jgi:hypothetical protein|nr:hypothetical protein [Peptococcaceae bacterium]